MANTIDTTPSMTDLFDLVRVARLSALTPDPVPFRTSVAMFAILAAGSADRPAVHELVDLFEAGSRYLFATLDGGPASPAADALTDRLEGWIMDGVCCEDRQLVLGQQMMIHILCDQIAEGADHDPLVAKIVGAAAHLLMARDLLPAH